MIDRDIYFDAVRETLFGSFSQQQVDGQNVILALWDYQAPPNADLRHLSYMLATVFHECATKMWPTTEYGSQEYLESREYWPYIGRGLVQLTWEVNYRKASDELGLIDDRDLVDFPNLALDSLISARIMFRGMAEGWFTGKKLSQYFSSHLDDPVGARKIINPDDNGPLIAGYHDAFLAALQEAETEAPGPATQTLTYKLTIIAPAGDVSIEVEQQT